MNDKLSLGIIGLSPGNGHPYSWSAICNGYKKMALENCGFPAIPKYLSEHSFPADFIKNALVTHIWTQDTRISKDIAFATNIKYIVDDFRDLIGEVDGVLLARDDAQTHFYYSRPFLEAGIPIYIDKPLAFTINDARQMLDHQVYSGQLFSCSALRYAKELRPQTAQLNSLGKILYVGGATPKDWDKYAIHIIEPMLNTFPELGSDVVMVNRRSTRNTSILYGECASGLEFEIKAMGDCSVPISITIAGENDSINLVFRDPFSAFKEALQTFVDLTCKGVEALSSEQMMASVLLVEEGR